MIKKCLYSYYNLLFDPKRYWNLRFLGIWNFWIFSTANGGGATIRQQKKIGSYYTTIAKIWHFMANFDCLSSKYRLKKFSFQNNACALGTEDRTKILWKKNEFNFYEWIWLIKDKKRTKFKFNGISSRARRSSIQKK